MYRLFSLASLLLVLVGAEPRTPKIYNVLISTKKNLSPSHALPVYEPVLRTTSLGLALPPVFYQTPLGGYQQVPLNTDNLVPPSQSDNQKNQDSMTQKDQALQPLPVEQFIPYPYGPQLLNNQPFYTQLPQGPQLSQAPQLQQGSKSQEPQQLQGSPLPQVAQLPLQLPQRPQLQQLPNQEQQRVEDPKNVIANLKRNPEIPDVPPPALPVKNS